MIGIFLEKLLKFVTNTAILMALLQSVALTGQAQLVSDYRFDNCSADDFVGSNDGFILGSPCVCGVRSSGFKLNGSTDFVEFGSGLNEVFSGDFSMSFYIQFDPMNSEPQDVFSIAERCRTDSVFLLRYIPQFNQLRINFSDSPDNSFLLNGAVDNPACWNYIVFTKEGAIGRLYINDILVDESNSISPLSLKVNDNLSLANSPCATGVPRTDVRFRGSIDEFKIFRGVLTQREIVNANLKPDQLLVRDTTIFSGGSVLLRTGGSCSSDFQWTPFEGLNDAQLLEPVATPELGSTTYMLTVSYGNCTITDDVVINVVDRDIVSCADLMLPTAFTPNGDGINDGFGISNIYLIQSLSSFEIFNKWGGRVFGTRESNELWNGTHNNTGEPAGNDSYVYKVKYTCDNNEFVKTGTVTLIR